MKLGEVPSTRCGIEAVPRLLRPYGLADRLVRLTLEQQHAAPAAQPALAVTINLACAESRFVTLVLEADQQRT